MLTYLIMLLIKFSNPVFISSFLFFIVVYYFWRALPMRRKFFLNSEVKLFIYTYVLYISFTTWKFMNHLRCDTFFSFFFSNAWRASGTFLAVKRSNDCSSTLILRFLVPLLTLRMYKVLSEMWDFRNVDYLTFLGIDS